MNIDSAIVNATLRDGPQAVFPVQCAVCDSRHVAIFPIGVGLAVLHGAMQVECAGCHLMTASPRWIAAKAGSP